MSESAKPIEAHRPIPRRRPVRWLLIIPFVAILYVPSYNAIEPRLIGVPFFYWYQLVWVLLCAVIIGTVHGVEKAAAR